MVEHSWSKKSLVTQSDRHGLYDAYECTACGITGKRFGLSPTITRDAKFSKSDFAECDPEKVRLMGDKKYRRKLRRERRKASKRVSSRDSVDLEVS